jgi:outer membrane protein OmpA-like peptidoglycan-associated protein
MNNKIQLTIAVACAMAATTLAGTAQVMTRDAKRVADGFYKQGDYSSAAKYYEQVLVGNGSKQGTALYQMQRSVQNSTTGKTTHTDIYYRLGESYRLLNNYTQAEGWYGKVVKEAAADYPLAALYYGISLRANGNYPAAEKALHAFLDTYKTKDQYQQQAQKEIADLVFIQQHSPKAEVVLSKLGNSINTEGANYAAAWLNESTLLFTSTRTAGKAVGGKAVYTNALYTAPVQNETPGEATKLLLPATGEAEQGVATISPDGNTLFFTGWTVPASGTKRSAIYVSKKNATGWSTPSPLSNGINAATYSARQPFITPDGQYLLFASDRPGGSGGFDIWYAPLNSKGEPGKAINAGAMINTKGNEEAPFYHAGSTTLVFASNGRVGMGGYDLYAARGTINSWSEPQNLGAPVNSVKDDLYFASRGTGLLDQALLSSDRSSACCLELFAVHTKAAPVVVVAAPEKEVPAVAVTVPAPVVNKPEEKTVLVVREVLFAFNEATIDPTSATHLDQVVTWLLAHPASKVEVGAHTDGKGSTAYNLELSEKRARSCVAYLVGKGIAADRLLPKGYGECCPLEKETTAAGEDIPAAREKNRRLEIKVPDSSNRP